jgi:hypothetical protein
VDLTVGDVQLMFVCQGVLSTVVGVRYSSAGTSVVNNATVQDFLLSSTED